MPYFPLIVVFCQRYVTSAGIGTLLALMLPFAVTVLVVWTAFLLGFWAPGIRLGLGAGFTSPA
jgi:aminobenzoyl-glutamate transport protein